MIRIALVLCAALLLYGCPSSRKVTRIHMGMSYETLENEIGRPDMKTVQDSATTVYYYTTYKGADGDQTPGHYYCVTIRNGQVQQHGLCPSRK